MTSQIIRMSPARDKILGPLVHGAMLGLRIPEKVFRMRTAQSSEPWGEQYWPERGQTERKKIRKKHLVPW
jgi:hypothetical protein